MKNDWDVGLLLGQSSGYWKGCAIQAAVRLDVFTILSEGASTAGDVAEVIHADSRAVGLLLDALSAMELLEKEGSSYRDSKFSRQFLNAKSPSYMGHIILHHHHILDGWAQLDKAVKTGKKVERRSYGAEAERESFLMGMFNLAMGIAPKIAPMFDLSGRKRLLDLGGGPGTYAIHFCLANPELSAVILDRETTAPFARKTVERFDLSDRIDFISGDFNKDSFTGGPYDVAWLSHILHSNSYDECQECIVKTVEALEPGGLILVHDFILNDNKDGPEFPALFALNMLVGTENGRSYSQTEIISMLETAGVKDIEHHDFRAPNDSSILYGTKGV